MFFLHRLKPSCATQVAHAGPDARQAESQQDFGLWEVEIKGCRTRELQRFRRHLHRFVPGLRFKQCGVFILPFILRVSGVDV